MSHLLVATDFSEVAENTVRYACELAGHLKADVVLLHSFMIPVTFSDTPMPIMPVDEGKEIAEERMDELVNSLRQSHQEITITSKIMFGDIVDCIEEYAEKETPLMIFLGNSGSGESNLWLGSNVLSALKSLAKTVVAVPKDASYKKPEKVCFACDFKHIADDFQSENLVSLLQAVGGQLHVLNVDHQNKNYSSDTPLESTALHRVLAPLNPVYHYVEKENIEEGIQEFIEANHMDWLVIVPHKHSFFESLFHKSHTKAIMKMVHIPLVAIHEK
jgi:nucleotide-binding universal stress UspA family protein